MELSKQQKLLILECLKPHEQALRNDYARTNDRDDPSGADYLLDLLQDVRELRRLLGG